jgi:hypothetical protein
VLREIVWELSVPQFSFNDDICFILNSFEMYLNVKKINYMNGITVCYTNVVVRKSVSRLSSCVYRPARG